MKSEVDYFSFVFKVLGRVGRLSNIKPRYFIVGVEGISLLLSDTGGSLLVLKRT